MNGLVIWIMENEPKVENEFMVHGIAVKIYDNGTYRIFTSSLFEAQRVKNWLIEQGIFEVADE